MRMPTFAASLALAIVSGTPLAAQTTDEPLVARVEPEKIQLPIPWLPAESSAEVPLLSQLVAIKDHESGPDGLNAIIALNPNAQVDLRVAVDGGLPLAGRTVLVKDNIETHELPTTAGSLALEANATARDAPLIARLRAAGGVVLGKTNLSEWANIRSSNSTSGWSAVGGLTRNPHALDRNACGSSSGRLSCGM